MSHEHHHHHHDHPHEHHHHHHNEQHHDHPHEHHHDHPHEHHHHHENHAHHHDHAHAHLSLTTEQLVADLNINDCGWTLWKFGHWSPQDNGILAFLSISLPMGLLQVASKGHTFREIASTFKFPPAPVMEAGFHDLFASLQSENEEGGQHVHLVTAMFVPSGSVLHKDFLHVAETKFHMLLKNIDYAADNVVGIMNSQIEELTQDKALAAVSAEDIQHHASVVVICSSYFECHWKEKFDIALTEQEPFYNSGGRKVDVYMMKATGKFPYYDASSIGGSVIGLPFAGERYMMMLLLPHKRYGLAEMEKRLDAKFIDTAHENLKTESTISLKLPRFAHKSSLDIQSICDKMGMKAMFHDTADLSGMIDKHHKEKVTKFVQKSSITINEEGAWAPDAEFNPGPPERVDGTANTAQDNVVLPEDTEEGIVLFHVDHPFVYYILDRKFNYVVTMGIQAKCGAQ